VCCCGSCCDCHGYGCCLENHQPYQHHHDRRLRYEPQWHPKRQHHYHHLQQQHAAAQLQQQRPRLELLLTNSRRAKFVLWLWCDLSAMWRCLLAHTWCHSLVSFLVPCLAMDSAGGCPSSRAAHAGWPHSACLRAKGVRFCACVCKCQMAAVCARSCFTCCLAARCMPAGRQASVEMVKCN